MYYLREQCYHEVPGWMQYFVTVFLSLWGEMYHRWILRLNMKAGQILVSLFSSFTTARGVKGTWPLQSHVMFCGDGKTGWVSAFIQTLEKRFSWVAFLIGGSCTADCIFQAGRDKTSLMIRRHSRQNRNFRTSGTCSYNRESWLLLPKQTFFAFVDMIPRWNPHAFHVSNLHLVIPS